MGNNFTVVQFQRQHFGNQPGTFNDIEPDVPFVGAAKDFLFDCPNVNPDETAFLLLQSRDVDNTGNIFQVNGVQVFGGLPVSPSRDTWNGNVLLIESHHQLRQTGNVLRVESRNTSGDAGGDIDDFIIDNVVIQYKTLDCSLHGIFDVKCYGAKGDGNTDDLDSILAARDAVNAAGGGILFFPPGRFVVSNAIELGARTTVAGSGASSVLEAKPGVDCFNMLLVRNSDDVRVRDLVLDGNRAKTNPPAEDAGENVACGFFGQPAGKGQTGLSITSVIARNHHGCGIRIVGPNNDDNLYLINPNEVEVIGCQILDCGSRGIILTRATRARIAGNIVTRCMQAGVQLVSSRSAVIDGNVIQDTKQEDDTNGGHGITVANCFDYVIVNNVAEENARWGIVASGGVGIFPDQGHPMSKRYVVANNICRKNCVGGITLDPSTRDPITGKPTGVIQDSFATVASNVCVGNKGNGIQTVHAGYLAVRGNICDANDNAGIALLSSRYTVVADNVLTCNRYGVGFWGDPADMPPGAPDLGHHLLGGNVYDKNEDGEIWIGANHPAIRQMHDLWPGSGAGGMNLPVKTIGGAPPNPVEGVLYLDPDDHKLKVYANGAWRTLQVE